MDYLALHAHTRSDTIYAVGNQIGIGKESDIFAVADASGSQHVLKIQRLGRISFRRVRNTRDYLRKRGGTKPGGGSIWMHMSRLAALKEYTFMRALYDAGFRVPRPIAHNRHTVVMELIDAFPLRKIASVPDPAGLYAELMDMIVQLAGVGLIHGDFNEFNILVREEEDVQASADADGGPTSQSTSDSTKPASSVKLTPFLIDFPQMVSIGHTNAKMYFDRDVQCIKHFFRRRFGFTSDESGPHFEESTCAVQPKQRIDMAVEASGFSKKMAKELEKYMEEVGVDGDRGSREAQQLDEESEGEAESESGSDGSRDGDDEDQVHREKERPGDNSHQSQGLQDTVADLGRIESGIAHLQAET